MNKLRLCIYRKLDNALEVFIMPKFKEKIDNNNAICPYCGGCYQVETEDYSEDSRQEECPKCGKKFWMHQNFSVTTHTKPDCHLNGQEHQFELVTFLNGRRANFCKVCADWELVRCRVGMKKVKNTAKAKQGQMDEVVILSDLLKTLTDKVCTWKSECPKCKKDCGTTSLLNLIYTFEVCHCTVVPYPHLVERVWHKDCFCYVREYY